jgi:uncharacterized cysteine cluster protein YcgN (CxxCxxCC family)
MADDEQPFWKTKTLSQMTQAEWESLCDGCGKCCLNKLIDTDTEELFFTNVACRLLDTKSCQCTRYKDRSKLVKDCIPLTPRNVKTIRWLPDTCAYRLVAQGKDLYDWHHLVCGDRNAVHRAGMSARGRIISEKDAGELEDHLVDWVAGGQKSEVRSRKSEDGSRKRTRRV